MTGFLPSHYTAVPLTPSAASVQSDLNPPTCGQGVTFTATVTSNYTIPTGTVTVR